jgi:hypothetical protein
MAGERRYVGIGEEAVFGTAVAAVQFLDFVRAEVDVPSEPVVAFGGSANRALQRVIPGPYVPRGSLEVPVDLDTVGYFLKWALGRWMTEGTDHAVPANTTLAAAANAGDGTITVNDEAGFQAGDYVQVDAVPGGEPEIVKIQALDGGAGPTYTWTLEWALKKGHPNGVAVKRAQAPFKHVFWHTADENLPSFTLRIGKQLFEHTFLGATIGQLSFSVERGFLTARMEVVARKDQKDVLDSSTKTLPASLLSFRQGQTTINPDLTGQNPGTDVTQYVESYSLEINNNVDEETGVRHGSRFPREFFLGGVDVSGSVGLAFKNTDEYERFWGGAAGPSESQLTEFIFEERFVEGGLYLALITTRAHYTRVSAPVQGRDRITQEVSFQGIDNSDWLGPMTVWLNNNVPAY